MSQPRAHSPWMRPSTPPPLHLRAPPTRAGTRNRTVQFRNRRPDPRRSSPPSAPRAADSTSTSGCQGLPVYRSSSMSSSQQSITTPVVIGEPLVGGFPTDMDVDDDNLALLDAHDTPSEKVDANFFNGEPGHRIRAPTPRATRLARASRGRACLCPQWHSPHSSRLVIHRFRGRLRRRRRGMNDTCVHACIRHWCKPS